MNKIKFLAASCSAALVVMGPPAFAEEGSDTAAEGATSPGDIIVTATLRNENLQDVPLAVTAFDGASLERSGVRDLRGLERVSASFNTNSSNTESGGTIVRIRGVGTTGNNTGLESAVGIFLDGVYLSRPGVALGDLLDVEAVEVLRGPQGTLFGRNTSAGAIQIRTTKPDLDKIDAFANFTYGNYDLMNVQAGGSVPIVPGQLAVRLSGAWRDRDGWLTNATGGESNNRNRYLVRGQLYWEPTSDIDVRLIGDYSRFKEKCCDSIIIRESSYATSGIYTATGLPNNGGVTASGPQAFEDLRTSNNYEFQDKMTQWGMSGELNWDLGGGRLTSITSYRKSKAEPRNESDMVAANVFSGSVGTSSASPLVSESYTEIKTFTQELRFAGSAWDDRIDFLFGGYYANEKIDEVVSYTLGADHQQYISAALMSVGVPGPNPARTVFAGGVSSAGNYAVNNYRQKAENWSLFTNNTFHFTDQFAFNFGLRYSNDRKEGSFDQLAASSPACAAVIARAPLLPASLQALAPIARALTCFPFTTQAGLYPAGPTEFNRVFKDDALIYTLKLTGELSDNVNTYVSYSKGYKSGGFNLDSTAAAAGADPRFKSEEVEAYEAGIKTRLLDRRLTANLALFYQNFDNFQVLEFTGVQYVTFNVPKVKSSGFELELTARPSDELTVNGSLTYADARYPNDCGGDAPPLQVATLCGNSLSNAPKLVAITGFDYNKDIGSNLNIGFSASARLESDRRTGTQAITAVAAGTGTEGRTLNYIRSPFDIQDGNVKVNARIAIGSQDQLWQVELWGTNIFDERTYFNAVNTPLRGVSNLPGPINAGGASLSRVVFPQEPRMYGVTLRSRF